MGNIQRYTAADLPSLMEKITKNSIGLDNYLENFWQFPTTGNYPPYNLIQLSNHDIFTAFTITLNSSSIAEGIALRSESLELMSNWVDGSFELITIFGEQTRW